MRVFNVTAGTRTVVSKTKRVIVGIYNQYIEYGYCDVEDKDCILVLFKVETGDLIQTELRMFPNWKDHCIFSINRGYYIIKRGLKQEEIDYETKVFGYGCFPYTFKRYYEALESFNLFYGKQETLENNDYKLTKYLKYTFGLEFETSMGYIPEDICFRDGLIPLRDGSITGIEYSTVVLNGANGLNLLKQQTETLKKYTYFNKECALHIHLGGFPVDPKSIFILYTLGCLIENELQRFVPKYTFYTSKYKNSGKDYCKPLERYSSFESLYEHLVGQSFNGDLTLPHPSDEERNHKWDCHSRYYYMNIINMLCYDKCKTVEFRFLRPSFNFYKIYLWLYILNGLLLYAEELSKSIKTSKDLAIISAIKQEGYSFDHIIRSVYPKDVADGIMYGITLLSYSVTNQTSNQDFWSHDVNFEDMLIDEESVHSLL